MVYKFRSLSVLYKDKNSNPKCQEESTISIAHFSDFDD